MEVFLLLLICVFLGVNTAGVLFRKQPKVTYLGNSREIGIEKDITTATPIPISAATCSHNWDVLDDKMLDMPHEKKHILVLQCRTCGMLDKTCAITTPAPPPKLLPAPPCSHNWEAVVSNTLEADHEKKIVAILTCKNCGKVDKTVETTSPPPAAPPIPWTKEQCRHKWDVEKRVVLDSAYEQMLESIKIRKDSYSSAKKIDPNKCLDLDLQKAPPWMFKKTYICVRTCTTCGEIDKTVASNIESEEDGKFIPVENKKTKGEK